MTPPQMHMHWEVLFKAGMLAIITVGEPGTHGAGVFGMQGMGVSTPMAALVADATVGLASDMHIPNGGIFTIGLLSMMFAAGGPPHITLLTGRTFKDEGAIPKLHISIAPETTSWAIIIAELALIYPRTGSNPAKIPGVSTVCPLRRKAVETA